MPYKLEILTKNNIWKIVLWRIISLCVIAHDEAIFVSFEFVLVKCRGCQHQIWGGRFRWELLICQALCIISEPSANSNWGYSPETPNSVQNWRFLSRVTLKLDGWPWKTIGQLFYATSSFVCHFVASSEFKLELQSGNAQFGSRSAIFFVRCDLEIWRMTLKNNRAPLLCYFKLCASFHNHRWIQTGVTVRKHPVWVKISYFLPRVTLKFDGWPWKIIEYVFNVTSSFVHHLEAISEFKLELQSGNAQFGSKLAFFVLCGLEIWRMTMKK